MKKISLENVIYHLIPSGIVFLLYVLLHLFFKELPLAVAAIFIVFQMAIMQFIMNANTMAKKPYLTVTNISGYVKPKHLVAFVLNVVLVSGLISGFYILTYQQLGTVLLNGPLNKWPAVFIYSPTVQSGLWTTIDPILTLVVWGILQPLYEGIYFRGFLLFDMRKLKWFGVLLSALLFAITHVMTLQYFIYYLLLGAVLSSITYMTKNLYIGIVSQWVAYGAIGAMTMLRVL